MIFFFFFGGGGAPRIFIDKKCFGFAYIEDHFHFSITLLNSVFILVVFLLYVVVT